MVSHNAEGIITMKRIALAVAVAMGSVVGLGHAANVPSYVSTAVADKARPEKDTARDADRKPAEIMTLAGVSPGKRVVDVGPGAGYYLRIISRIVGAKGHVYGFNPTWVAEKFPVAPHGVTTLASNGYANVESVVQAMADIKIEPKVDIIFISQLYHDQHWQKVDIAKMNKAIFDTLKPGGIYFIIDHIGRGVSTVEQIDKVHRIDPSIVREEVLAAGFELVTDSDLLRNPYDLGDKSVFDPTIRGHTDQFIFKFRKPRR